MRRLAVEIAGAAGQLCGLIIGPPLALLGLVALLSLKILASGRRGVWRVMNRNR